MTFKDFLDVTLFVGFCFLTAGTLLVSWSDKFYKVFYENYLLHPEDLFYWGLGLFAFNLIYGLNLYFSSKGSCLSIKMSSGLLEIDKKLLKDLIDLTTKRSFADLNMESEVEIQEDQTLSITAKSDPIDFKKHKMVLKKLEKEIGLELSNTLSYKRPFLFNLKMR